MSDIALSVRNLTKEYRIRHNAERHDRVTEAIAGSVKGIFRKKEVETFRALDDISFNVKKGEVLGIIGRNGAGKSTLLKILSRITEPTSGEIHLFGRVGSLLEVGTGFHPELTGRENIYLNGSILGMRRREIDRQFDAIVDFAEVEKFLDTPVKRYSSGMYVRLAFAVAAHLNPEILIVDEVLAVGDAQFQKKCLDKIYTISSQSGATVLIVSHNLAHVTRLCNQVLYLKHGLKVKQGESSLVIAEYLEGDKTSKATNNVVPAPFKDAWIDTVRNDNQICGGSCVTFCFRLATQVPHPICSFTVYSDTDNAISHFNSANTSTCDVVQGDRLFRCTIKSMPLIPGTYHVNASINTGTDQLTRWERALEFSVIDSIYPDNRTAITAKGAGHVHIEHCWQTPG